ncbi:calcium-binding protein, partial [uncultured Maritimibacter sp.]|uniref:calcium-binding protein n=1 Tax=uncultured Maritimibacter sp. TaxID=991866 RepID=UPI00262234AC
MTIQTVGHFTTEDPALDTDLDDLKIVDLGGTLTLFAASGQNGGLSSWSIGSTGAASLVDSVVFNPGWTLGMASDVEIVARPGGGYEVLVGSASSGVLTGYAATTAGQINAATSWSGLGTSLSRITDYEDTVAGLALADTAGRLGFLTRNANGSVASVNLIADSDATHLAHVSTLASTTVGGATILIAGDAGEDGLTSFVIGPGGPVVANTIGPNDGLGIMDPTGIEFVTLLGQTYAIVASAQGEAGMLTVLHVSSSGEMTRTDEVFDDLGTRFGGVQAIATVELGGQVFVGAGGADDGFSLFVLLPGGQLQHLETIENTWTTGVAGQAALADVTAMVAAESGGKLRFFIASGEAGGVTQLGYEPGAAGVQMIAPSTGATLTGGASNDLLVGGTGDDTITGGSGNDIIVDGAGIDTLSGGSGADTFVLRHDGAQDTILDFNPTQDKLDLSHWVFFYDPASLGVTSTATGALVTFRSETLILNSATGGSITAAQVRAAVIDNPKHGIDFTTFTMPPPSPPEPEPEPEPEPDPLPPPDPDPIPDPTPGPDPSPTPDPTPPPPPPPVSVPEPPARNYDIKDTARSDKIYGTSRSESIRISYGSDTVKAYSGHDLVEGGYGKNSIWLGKGNDRFNDLGQSGAWDGDKIYGESGNDVIIAGAGNDYIDGGSGKDRLYGGGGHDRLYGRTSSDHLDGGSGNDRLYGHSGNDRLYGGTEDDYLSGSTGSDRLYGGAGNDVLKGGSSKDKLYGEDGNDRLYGGSSADTLYGGNGDDYLDGSTSSDKLYGGAGN